MTSDAGGKIEIRELDADRIELIREIDRSEHIDVQYAVKDGRLRSERVDFEVPPWDSEGHGDHSSARRITEFRPIVDNGAISLGAFIDGLFAGIAIVDPSFEKRTATPSGSADSVSTAMFDVRRLDASTSKRFRRWTLRPERRWL